MPRIVGGRSAASRREREAAEVAASVTGDRRLRVLEEAQAANLAWSEKSGEPLIYDFSPEIERLQSSR